MRVGLVGWRGMVGSVLMQRMVEERDFDLIEPVFFSTSQIGVPAPNFGKDAGMLHDAFDIESLKQLDAVITCQGGSYTERSTQHCVKRVGKVTGSMLHRHCVWIKRRSSLWIPLTLNKFCMVFIMVQKPLSVVTVL